MGGDYNRKPLVRVLTKIANTWREASSVVSKIAGNWRPSTTEVYIKHNGV